MYFRLVQSPGNHSHCRSSRSVGTPLNIAPKVSLTNLKFLTKRRLKAVPVKYLTLDLRRFQGLIAHQFKCYLFFILLTEMGDYMSPTDLCTLFGKHTGRYWWQPSIKIAGRKLLMFNTASTLEDLKVAPNNRLEKLTGDRKDDYSIRINDQWRVCFKLEKGEASEVEIVDYH